MNIWFNRTFSSIHAALRLIREADTQERFTLIASGCNRHALARLHAHHYMIEPEGLSDNHYVDWCLDFCVEHAIGVLVPGREARNIAARQAEFAAYGVRVLSAASPDSLDVLNDKAAFYAALDCSAAPAPERQVFDTCQAFDIAYAELSARHPVLCIKPAVSVYGIGFRRIRTDRDAYAILSSGMNYQINLDSLRALLAERSHIAPMLLMEYLDGHEYSVDCLAEHGTLHCAIARRKPLNAGEGQIIDGQANLQLACRQIVSQFGLNGYINIQFRQGRTGLRTLEVNPRLSGGAAMACLAGPNLPYLGLCGLLDGYAALKIPPIAEGLRVGEINQAIILP